MWEPLHNPRPKPPDPPTPPPALPVSLSLYPSVSPSLPLAVIPAGWPVVSGESDDADDGCVRLDPAVVLRATSRSFALRVRGQSMVGADICDGDIVIGEFTPEARPGNIVVALIDGESTLKRLIVRHGRAHLVSENPNYPDFVPLSELVIQGIVHTVVRGVT